MPFLVTDASLPLRRFVAGSPAAKAQDLGALLSGATVNLLAPALRDALAAAPDAAEEIGLTFATACIMTADLLAQRFPRHPWRATAEAAITHIADKGGVSPVRLIQEGARIADLGMELDLAEYVAICRQMDTAVERRIFMRQESQGEAQVRTALARLARFIAWLDQERAQRQGALAA